MDGPLLVEHFEPHVGKAFRFVGTDFTLPLDRIVLSKSPAPPDAPRQPFVLIFSGDRGADVLPEGLYDCIADGTPTFSLHLAPIHTPDRERQDYQAVFN